LTSDEDDKDFASITSDMLLFFRIGFLLRNELFFDSLLAGSVTGPDIL